MTAPQASARALLAAVVSVVDAHKNDDIASAVASARTFRRAGVDTWRTVTDDAGEVAGVEIYLGNDSSFTITLNRR